MTDINSIEHYKQQSGAEFYAGCVGKTTLNNQSELYKLSVELSEVLVSNGIGVIHGGYEDGNGGGTMQAYAEGANNIIEKKGLNKFYNIGVPEARFDKKRGVKDRTKHNTQFTKPLDHIDTRCGLLIDSADFLVVNQLAGNGTLREVFTMYERNDIHKPSNLGYGKISPIIFYGDNWKKLFDVLNDDFKIGTKVENDNDLFFVNSIEDYKKAVLDVIKKLNIKD